MNGRFLARPVTGVERYGREVAHRLRHHLRTLHPPGPARGFLGHLWEQCVLPTRLEPGELLWSPANTGPIGLANQVVTIHDASPLDHPEWFDGLFARAYGVMIPKLVSRSRRVITSSAFSRDRLLKLTGAPSERIVVVSPGVDRERFHPPTARAIEEARGRYGLSKSYLLAVGSLNPRKNIGTLLTAWESLRPRHPHLELAVVGEAPPTARGETTTERAPPEVFLGRVPDSELPALYGGARAFVYPSLYEGFGLPVLEAMACGTPVICSDRTGIPEAAGGAGELFDPDDPGDLARKLDQLLGDPARRTELANRGLHRAERMSWDRTARGVLRALSESRA